MQFIFHQHENRLVGTALVAVRSFYFVFGIPGFKASFVYEEDLINAFVASVVQTLDRLPDILCIRQNEVVRNYEYRFLALLLGKVKLAIAIL